MANAKASPHALSGWVSSMMSLLETAKGHSLTDAESGDWLKELKDMAKEHGMMRTESALRDALRRSESATKGFMPKFAEVWSRIPREDRRQVERCGRCKQHDGFIPVMVDGEKYVRAKSCSHDELPNRIEVAVFDASQPNGQRRVMATVLQSFV